MNMTIYGGKSAIKHRLLSVMFRPCVPSEQSGTCQVKDLKNQTELMEKLEEAKEYVGNAVLDIYHS